MLTNNTNIPLSVALWLAHDEYDHHGKENTISATSLLKPLKSIVLGMQAGAKSDTDIADLIPSKMGTAIHTSIENSWETANIKAILTGLGVPENIAKKIKIDPIREKHGDIIVRMEERTNKDINGYTITGKFDFVMDGLLEDFKSTSTYTWINKSNVEQYILQGSIYRWLNPDIITQDFIQINYIFTDWSAAKAKQDSKYPSKRILAEKYPLKSIEEIHSFISTKVEQIKFYSDNIDKLPECKKEELWQNDSVFKYFKNPNGTRATKNFTSYQEANDRLLKDGTVGIIKEFKGEPRRCKYCNAISICEQAKNYIAEGVLTI